MTTLDVDTVTQGTSLPAGYDKRLMITSGRASRDLATKIAGKLGLEVTDPGLKTFTDGEVYCRYADSIRGADLFIVQSIAGNPPEGVNVTPARACAARMRRWAWWVTSIRSARVLTPIAPSVSLVLKATTVRPRSRKTGKTPVR